MHTPKPSARRAFTLIELLTVIAIIGILAAIIIPTVGKVRATAKESTALSNLRQLATATLLFAADNKDYAPCPKIAQDKGVSPDAFRTMLFNFVGGSNQSKAEIFADPSSEYYRPQSDGRWPEQYASNLWLSGGNGTTLPTFSIARIQSPSSVICMIDGVLNTSSDLNQAPNVFWEPSVSAQSNPTAFITTSNTVTSSGWDGKIAYRAQNNTAAKASFFDGHVEIMKKGTIQNRHIYPNL